MRNTLTVLSAAAIACTLGVAADAAVSGPARVTPSHQVSFHITGMAPHRRLQVLLQPTTNRGGNGFGRTIRPTSRTSASGRATVRLTWPATYAICSGASSCTTVRWTPGQRVDVTVCPRDRTRCAGRRVVRITG